MIEINVNQSSEEWHKLRIGILTASLAHKMITSTGAKSRTWDQYKYQLVSERLTGERVQTPVTRWMEHGIENEPRAAELYQLHHDVVLRKAGFCYMDEWKQCGFSPDRIIVGARAGLEIKCVSPAVHAKYLTDRKLPTDKAPQVYSSLYMSGFDYWDFMSYHPDMTPLYVRVTKTDADYLRFAKAFDILLPQFINEVQTNYNDLNKAAG